MKIGITLGSEGSFKIALLSRFLCRLYGSQSKAARILGISQANLSFYCRDLYRYRQNGNRWLNLKTRDAFEKGLREIAQVEPLGFKSLLEALLACTIEDLSLLDELSLRTQTQAEAGLLLRYLIEKQGVPVRDFTPEEKEVTICWDLLSGISVSRREKILQEIIARHRADKVVRDKAETATSLGSANPWN